MQKSYHQEVARPGSTADSEAWATLSPLSLPSDLHCHCIPPEKGADTKEGRLGRGKRLEEQQGP